MNAYERCQYFNGIQHKACDAGVTYDSVEDSAHRWPCLTLIGREPATTTCALRVVKTRAELDADNEKLKASAVKALTSLAEGTCPTCGAPIEPSRVAGRCRYASCGHRLGQVGR